MAEVGKLQDRLAVSSFSDPKQFLQEHAEVAEHLALSGSTLRSLRAPVKTGLGSFGCGSAALGP